MGRYLAALNAERAGVAVIFGGAGLRVRRHPIRCVAELVGADTDSERAIPRLMALMVVVRSPAGDCVDDGSDCEVAGCLSWSHCVRCGRPKHCEGRGRFGTEGSSKWKKARRAKNIARAVLGGGRIT